MLALEVEAVCPWCHKQSAIVFWSVGEDKNAWTKVKCWHCKKRYVVQFGPPLMVKRENVK